MMDKDIKVSMWVKVLHEVQFPSTTSKNIWYGRAIVEHNGRFAIIGGMMFDDEEKMNYFAPVWDDWHKSEKAALNSSSWKWACMQEGSMSLCPK